MKFFPPVLLATLAMLGAMPLWGQMQMTLYHMPQVPQSYALNPGKIPLVKTYVGIPTLSGVHVDANADNMKYNDIKFATDGNLYDFDFARLNTRIGDAPVEVEADASLKAISFGTRISSGFIHAEISEQVFSDLRLNRDLAYLGEDLQDENRGIPGGSQYDFGGTEFSGSYVRSYSAGYTHVITPRLTAGIRAHYLEGMAFVRVGDNDLVVEKRAEDDKFNLLGSIVFQASGLRRIDAFEGKYLAPGNKPGNGFAVDLGANYLLTDRIELSFSVLNLGGLTWKNELNSVVVSATSALAAYFESTDPDTWETGWDELYDALIEQGEDDGEEKIKQSLPVRLLFGGQYELTQRTTVGAVLQTRHSSFRGTDWGFAGSINTRFRKILGVSGALQYSSFGGFGLGLGFNADLGPVQLYFVSDNLFTTLDFKDATYATAEVGLNLVFGKLFRAEHLGYYGYRTLPE